MSITVHLSDEELADLRAFTKETDNEAAIRSAMTEYLRVARRMELKAASGKVSMEENWRTLEAAELRDANGTSGPGPR